MRVPSANVWPEPNIGMFWFHQTRYAPWQSPASESYWNQFMLLTVSLRSAPPAPPCRPKPVQLVETCDDVAALHGPSAGPSPHMSYWPWKFGPMWTLPHTGSYGVWMIGEPPLSMRS